MEVGKETSNLSCTYLPHHRYRHRRRYGVIVMTLHRLHLRHRRFLLRLRYQVHGRRADRRWRGAATVSLGTNCHIQITWNKEDAAALEKHSWSLPS